MSLAPEISFISHQEADWAEKTSAAAWLLLLLLMLNACAGRIRREISTCLKIANIFHLFILSLWFRIIWTRSLFLCIFQVWSVVDRAKQQQDDISLNSFYFSHQFYWAAHFFLFCSSVLCSWTLSFLSVVLCWFEHQTVHTMSALNSIQKHLNGWLYCRAMRIHCSWVIYRRLTTMTQASHTHFFVFFSLSHSSMRLVEVVEWGCSHLH